MFSFWNDQVKRSPDVSDWLPDMNTEDVPEDKDELLAVTTLHVPVGATQAHTPSSASLDHMRLGHIDELGFYKPDAASDLEDPHMEKLMALDLYVEHKEEEIPITKELSKQERNEQKARDFAKSILLTVQRELGHAEGRIISESASAPSSPTGPRPSPPASKPPPPSTEMPVRRIEQQQKKEPPPDS